MSDFPSPASSVTHQSDFASDSYEFTSFLSASPSADSLLNCFGNIQRGEPFNLDTSFIRRIDEEKNSLVDTTVYDLRKCNGEFVKGEPLAHKFKIDRLKQYLQTKYQTDDKYILIDNQETLPTCFIINEQQLSEVQILISSPLAFEEGFSNVSGEVTRSVSVSPDSDVRELLTKYNDATESSMDSLYFHKASLVVREGTLHDHGIPAFDRGRIFRDSKVDLRVHHFVDEKREMILHVQCLKSKNVREIKAQLKREFFREFDHIKHRGVELELWLVSGMSVLRDVDCIFLNECLDSNDQEFTLTAQIGDTQSIPVCFYFQREKQMVLVSQTANIQDFRHVISRMVHKPAKSLKILYKKKKVDDNTLISQFQQDSKRHILQVEVASEKVYPCVVVNMACPDGQKHKIDISAYKLDTLADLKRKAATCLQVNPFYLQLLLNASQTNENSTLHASKIRSGDIVQVVLFPNRIRICLRTCNGKRLFITVDETNKTTVSDLKTFCGQMWGTDPADMIIIFKGCILNEGTMTVFDAGIVFGSVLTASISLRTNQTQLQNVISLFIAGGESGITKTRAVKIGGRIIPVDDNVQFDEPLGASLPPIDNRHLKGLHIDSQQVQHSKGDTVARNLNQNLDMQDAIPSLDNVSPHHDSHLESRHSTYTTTAVCITTSTSSQSTTVLSNTVSPSNTAIQKQPKFYIGDDLSPGHNLYHYVDTQHVIRSPNGIVLGKHIAQSAFMAPLRLYGSHRSVSDSALAIIPSAQNSLLPQSLSLPDARNAVSDRVLNSLADALCNDWGKLGTELDVSYRDMQKIMHDRQNDLKGQALSMLHRWRTQCGSEATVERLCEALRKCNLVSYAEGIESGSVNLD